MRDKIIKRLWKLKTNEGKEAKKNPIHIFLVFLSTPQLIFNIFFQTNRTLINKSGEQRDGHHQAVGSFISFLSNSASLPLALHSLVRPSVLIVHWNLTILSCLALHIQGVILEPFETGWASYVSLYYTEWCVSMCSPSSFVCASLLSAIQNGGWVSSLFYIWSRDVFVSLLVCILLLRLLNLRCLNTNMKFINRSSQVVAEVAALSSRCILSFKAPTLLASWILKASFSNLATFLEVSLRDQAYTPLSFFLSSFYFSKPNLIRGPYQYVYMLLVNTVSWEWFDHSFSSSFHSSSSSSSPSCSSCSMWFDTRTEGSSMLIDTRQL